MSEPDNSGPSVKRTRKTATAKNSDIKDNTASNQAKQAVASQQPTTGQRARTSRVVVNADIDNVDSKESAKAKIALALEEELGRRAKLKPVDQGTDSKTASTATRSTARRVTKSTSATLDASSADNQADASVDSDKHSGAKTQVKATTARGRVRSTEALAGDEPGAKPDGEASLNPKAKEPLPQKKPVFMAATTDPNPVADTRNAEGNKLNSVDQASPGTATRLPAAALLFQAPDLSTLPPVSRRPVEEAGGDDTELKGSGSAGTGPATSEGAPTRPTGTRRVRTRGTRSEATRSQGQEDTKSEGTVRRSPSAPVARTSVAKEAVAGAEEADSSLRRRRRRRRLNEETDDTGNNEISALKGSTRLEAKRQRRQEGRREGRKRAPVTEAEFLARREAVDRHMVIREKDGLNQIAVIENGLLVEHYVARHTQASMVGNIYLGRVQNVLPSMEAAFVDLGKGRNAVLYAGEVNWDLLGLGSKPHRIEDALQSGAQVLVQVTKDPIGHKGARLTSQITLAGRYLVYAPTGSMTGISRKLPEAERHRLKRILKQCLPDGGGVIVRTAAEGATEEQLKGDIERLVNEWNEVQAKINKAKNVPLLVRGEPELAVRVVRDIFNEDFARLSISGTEAWTTVAEYVEDLSPDLVERLHRWTSEEDIFAHYRVDEQLAKGMDRKVWLPSGGSLVIDRTEAMTVVDVNTGKFTGTGGTLEETVTRNNLEAAEEIVRQLRLRDIGGIIVIDFVDMVLESNRDLVLRRLVECLGRDRTRHQVTEITSLGLVQMTRKRVSQGLVEAFSSPCEHCAGRGFIVQSAPVERGDKEPSPVESDSRANRRGNYRQKSTEHQQLVKIDRRPERMAVEKIVQATQIPGQEPGVVLAKEKPADAVPEANPQTEASKNVIDVEDNPRSEVTAPVVAAPANPPQKVKTEPQKEPRKYNRFSLAVTPVGNGDSADASRRRGGRGRVVSTGVVSLGSDASSGVMIIPQTETDSLP